VNKRLSWDLIASVLAVLETGSLSAAARSLGVTQPTIRRHLDELEADLGVSLFTRSPTGLIPTKAARDISPYAHDIHGLVAALVRCASADRDIMSGTIRVSCSEIMGNEILPFLVAPFLEMYPALTIELIASNRIENLLRRDADLAVRMVRPVQEGLVGRKVTQIPLGLYASRAYLDRCGTPLDLADLIANHRMIGEDRGTSIIDALSALSPDAVLIDFSYRSDSDSAQLAAIRASIGIGVCQVPIAHDDPRLHRILTDIESSLEVWLVTHEDLRDQHRVRTILDHLGSVLPIFAQTSSRQVIGAKPLR
jgi:DNA-binding transcriptional LysR family regulator